MAIFEDDDISINPIERDKKLKESKFDWELSKREKRSATYGVILVFIKRLSRFFNRNPGDTLETFSQDELVGNVQILKQIFQKLMTNDESKNASFCQQFSEVWHYLLQGITILDRTKRNPYLDVKKLKILITEMNNYPPEEDHKLGYYLSEYVGEKWLPAPFMNILKFLHSDFCINKNHSILQKWSDLIEETLQG